LPAATIETSISKVGDSYRLRLWSNVLARSVYVTFPMDARVSDNCFDLLPGEPVGPSPAPLTARRTGG
jgi:hypothetical protein